MKRALEVSGEFLAKDLVVARILSLLLLHRCCKLAHVELGHGHVHSIKVLEEGLEGLFGFQVFYRCDPLNCVPLKLAFHLFLRRVSLRHNKDNVCLANLCEFVSFLLELHPFVYFENECVFLVDLPLFRNV